MFIGGLMIIGNVYGMEYIKPLIYKYKAKESPVQGVIHSVSPDKTKILIKENNVFSLYHNGKIQVTNWKNIKKAQFSPNSRFIFIYTDNTIVVYDIDNPSNQGSFSLKNIDPNLIMFNPTSTRIIACQNNIIAQSVIISYDIASKHTTTTPSNLPIVSFQFNGDGSNFLAQTEESITVYNASSMIKLLTLPIDIRVVSKVKLMSTQLMVALINNTIQRYNFISANQFINTLTPSQHNLLTKIGNGIQKTKSERTQENQLMTIYRYITSNYFYTKTLLTPQEKEEFEKLPDWLKDELKKYIK